MAENNSDIALINLESLTSEKINEILNDYFIESEIDEDGDVVVNRPINIYIMVDKELGTLRFISFIHTKKDRDENIILKEIDARNSASSSVKYSKMANSILAEYGMPLFGHIDQKHLIKTINHVEEKVSLFNLMMSEYI